MFGVAIATAINRQPGQTVDCRFLPVIFVIGTDECSIHGSLLSTRF